MKTRFKTSSKPNKKSILENRNFLNSQNYILGKSEKKKLLSKFFIENIIYKYNNIFKLINKNLPNVLLSYIIIYIIIIIIPYLNGDNLGKLIKSFITTTPILLLTYFLFKDSELSKWQKFKYRNKNHFFIMNYSIFHIIIKYIITIVSLFFIFSNYLIIYPFLTIIIIFIGFLFILLDYIKILLFPVIGIFVFLNFIYGFYYMLIFKKSKGYNFYKSITNKKIFSKFSIINKNYAENEYYKIQLKNNENKI